MELRDILRIIWKRLWVIALGILLCGAGATIASSRMPRIYRAAVNMEVDRPASAPLAYASIATGENLALTYSELLRTRPLLAVVIANLDLNTTPDALRETVTTHLIPETPLLELAVVHSDAERAADIANEIATTFIALRSQENQREHMAAFEGQAIAQLASLQDLIARKQALIDRARLTSGEEASEEVDPALEAALVTQQATYANLLSSYLSIQNAQSQFYDVKIVDPAVAPTVPIGPQTPLHAFLGALLGLVASGGAVFLLEYLDRSVKSADDVRRAVGKPTLGNIPRLSSTAASGALISWSDPYSAASEAFRTLRTNIRFAGVQKTLTTLLVTSAEPGAGKTTVAANLAVVCAQAGLRVVLVDTDLRMPHLHAAFGLDNLAGLTDLLLSNAEDPSTYAQETEIDNLRVISSGPLPPNPAELLGSKRMEYVLKTIRRQADMVIVDSPPVLAVTDAAVLAPKADGVLLVARMHKTARDAVRHAAEALQQVGGEVVGVVLNGMPMPRSSFYRYYGGQYGPPHQAAGSRIGGLRRRGRRTVGEWVNHNG